MSAGLLFAAVADDDTGASDLAGMFADQGVRALLVLDPAVLGENNPWIAQAQAIVLATATRALPADRARTITAEAVRCAASLNPRTIQIKYCSTFDSTEKGNIGPSLEAALDGLGEAFTIAVPALPVNGRTTYLGHHFVKGQLLSDSPMRHHPLNPMTNSNLVEHLQIQTSRKVGLTPHSTVSSGVAAIIEKWSQLRASGCGMAIVDCTDEAQAHAIGEASCELKLISGSSIFGMHLPAAWRRRGWLGEPEGELWRGIELQPGKGRLVVAGSCSLATAAQNAWLGRTGAEVIEIDARVLAEAGAHDATDRAAMRLAGRGTVLLKTLSTADDIARIQRWGAEQGWSAAELGLRIARALAGITRRIIEAQTPEALVCAGGETTSAICRALGIRVFAAGRNIQPGIPVCFPLEGLRVPMALKSGNFGTEDFYGAAFDACAGCPSGDK